MVKIEEINPGCPKVDIKIPTEPNLSIKYSEIKVQLLDYMGHDDDRKPAKVARISYGNIFSDNEEGRTLEQDLRLSRYLMWHRHTSPFENIEFMFQIHAPLFVARQILRHRTASVNEISRRYVSHDLEMFDFELRFKDTELTKQGSGVVVLFENHQDLYNEGIELIEKSVRFYYKLIQEGIAPETARQFLPQLMMTTFTFKMDLHNLFHFLELRLDDHAQKEIRIVAQKILGLIEPVIPNLVEMFLEYISMKKGFMEVGYAYFKDNKSDEFNESLKEFKPKS